MALQGRNKAIAANVKLSSLTKIEELPSPEELGLPEKFSKFRLGQWDAAYDVISKDERFHVLCAPTGFGKSLAYMLIHQFSKGRTAILTSTKGLQDQLARDFEMMGMRDTRGQNAYKCIAAPDFGMPPYTSVAEGPCHHGADCAVRGECQYFVDYALAKQSALVVTNYAMWLYDGRKEKGLGEFDTLVLDEAHDAPDHLSSFLGVVIKPSEITRITKERVPEPGTTVIEWANWADWLHGKVVEKLEAIKMNIKLGKGTAHMYQEAGQYKKLGFQLATLASMRNAEWVEEEIPPGPRGGGREVRFDPLWPAKYAENCLFRGIKKIVLVSATARPKTAEILGIPEEEMSFQEYPSTFPVERRPFIWVPNVRMNFRTTAAEIKLWLAKQDNIIRSRSASITEQVCRRGIIHSVSYARMRLIQSNSKFAHLMAVHGTENSRSVIQEFQSGNGCPILVSPSVTTGYDFPYTQAEYQIIPKIPFPDNRAKVVKARMERDKRYGNYIAMQTLVQMYGRIMRAEDDIGETIILDDNISWFLKQNEDFAPQWFKEAYSKSQLIPPPLPKL